MNTAIASFFRHVCHRRRGDELLLSYIIFVVYFVLFSR